MLDVMLRVMAFGWSYFRSVWNVVDAIVLVLSFSLGLIVLYMNSVSTFICLISQRRWLPRGAGDGLAGDCAF